MVPPDRLRSSGHHKADALNLTSRHSRAPWAGMVMIFDPPLVLHSARIYLRQEWPPAATLRPGQTFLMVTGHLYDSALRLQADLPASTTTDRRSPPR